MPTRPFNDFLLDSLSRDLPRRGEGPGKSQQYPAQQHHRAQPCELPRCRHRAVAAGHRAGFRHRHHDGQKWWVRPFMRLTRAMPIDPLKPMATRTLINAVKDGETLIIFPEGRLTVTGSLMKVYDGAGLIADKSDATIVPVRIDGLEHSYFTRLTGDADAPAMVSENHGHGARAGEAADRSGVARQDIAVRRRAPRSPDHVEHDLQHDLDRPHHAHSFGRGGADTRHETDRGGGSGHRRAYLQASAARHFAFLAAS